MLKSADADYGFGYSLWKNDKTRLFGHSGNFAGFSSQFAIDDKQALGVAALTNGMQSAMSSLVDNIFVTINYCIKNKKVLLPITKKYLAYEGLYKNRWGYASIIAGHNCLIAFSPEFEPALSKGAQILKPTKDKDSFIISTGYGGDNIGETVLFDINGDSPQMLWGPTPYKKIINTEI